MKFDVAQWHKEILTTIMKNYTDGKKLRNVRPMRDGVYYEVFTGQVWRKKKLQQSTINTILEELAA